MNLLVLKVSTKPMFRQKKVSTKPDWFDIYEFARGCFKTIKKKKKLASGRQKMGRESNGEGPR